MEWRPGAPRTGIRAWDTLDWSVHVGIALVLAAMALVAWLLLRPEPDLEYHFHEVSAEQKQTVEDATTLTRSWLADYGLGVKSADIFASSDAEWLGRKLRRRTGLLWDDPGERFALADGLMADGAVFIYLDADLWSEERVYQVIAHELFHTVQERATRSATPPDWMVEGFAEYAADAVVARWSEPAATRQRALRQWLIRDLEGPLWWHDSRGGDAPFGAYLLGGEAIHFLEQRVGRDRVLEVWRRPGGFSVGEDFERAYGLDLNDFMLAFESYRSDTLGP